ncbi:MAG: amidohydrolase, partial [Cloacibacillus sp.]
MADIKALARKYTEYITERRRYYHAHPELTLREEETTKALMCDLREMGLEPKLFDGIFGCTAVLEGVAPGPAVLLRADIDALPVKEMTGLPFASQNDGVMHACGHDAHIAMQLGAAKILSDIKEELCGRVIFFFQPAEEIAAGAKAAVAQGLMEGVDVVYGAHVWGQLDAGKINVEGGERMASCDMFTLRIKGEASHGSAPHLGRDAAVAASAVIMALQTVTSRANDPLNSMVLTIGTFSAGNRFNIISDRAEMDGTVRTFNPKFRMEIEPMIRKIAEDVARGYGCTAELEYKYLCPAVINADQKAVDTARHAAASLFGEESLAPFEKLTGSEDFSFLLEKAAGVYCFIGGRSPEAPWPPEKNNCLQRSHKL